MITVSPVYKEELKEIFNALSLEYNENSGCVAARAEGETLGLCAYYLYEKGITVCTLTPEDDLLLADGILRSALHVAAERSAMDARYSVDAPKALFSKLGFIKNAEERTLDIDKLFGGCKCCKK